MGVVLGRLFTVVAVLAGTAGCERRHPAVIGFAFDEPHPNVVDVVHAEFARRPTNPREGDAPPEIAEPGPTNVEGAPGSVAVAAKLTALKGVIGVVGHYDSRGTLAAAPVYDEARIPLLVPTATSRLLHHVSPWVFMMSPDDSAEAEFIAEFAARALRARVAIVFYDNDEYGQGLRDALRTAFAARGLRTAAEEPTANPCEPGDLADAPVMRAAAGRPRPDLAVIASRTRDAGCLARRLNDRAPGIRIIGGDAVEPDSTLANRLGPGPITFFTVALWHAAAQGAISQRFAHQFDSIVGVPPHASQAISYDAIMLFAHAAREAGPSPAAVRQYLADLGVRRPAYAGVTGPLSFGAAAHRPLYMLRARTNGAQPVLVQ